MDASCKCIFLSAVPNQKCGVACSSQLQRSPSPCAVTPGPADPTAAVPILSHCHHLPRCHCRPAVTVTRPGVCVTVSRLSLGCH